MPLAGGVAALLLATLPGFFTFCRSSMSEISAAALIVLAFMFAYLGVKEKRRWKIYLSAGFLGLSLNIRAQSIFFAPLLLAMAMIPTKETRLHRLFHWTGAVIVFALAASPGLLMNTIQFHSPFKTGYDFWIPYWTENHLLFSLRYIPLNIVALWREFAQRPSGYFVANIFGTGTTFVPSFILLACTGLLLIRINRFVVCAFLAGSVFLVATACYKFGADIRFYLPILVILIAVATVSVTWAAKNLLAARRTIAALAIFILFAAACLGYPSHSGYNTVEINRLQAWDAVHFAAQPRNSTDFIAQKRFVELFGSHPGIVLSDVDPVYLNALLPNYLVAAPLDGNHHHRFSKIWRYGRPEALAMVRRGLDRSLPVYALFVSMKETATQQRRLPVLPGYEWTVAKNSSPEAVVLQLLPIASQIGRPL
jgi:uncharacterized membrane protein